MTKIISGGQTGADRAGLDAAMKLNIPVGGWCSKGRKAEMYINQALIDLLVEKGVLTHDEILEKIKELRVGQGN
ncbi:MAG: hypothetical protein GWP07_07385 [Xanthomonadaceae bacterium]|nr:hypothetical protein [Xanthomonadaceae bacterium]